MAVIRYTFLGTIELDGALHIGSGGGGRIGDPETQTDATVVRDSRGYPYIPGSSLRGVLRATVGQLAPALSLGELREDDVIRVAVTQAKEQRSLIEILDEAALQNLLNATLTPAERLFGTVEWASPLLISDLQLAEPRQQAGEIRHGVGIDRDTGAARDGAKFDFEVLPQGTIFKLKMRCDMPEQYRSDWSGLLAVGLRLLEQGDLPLGGRLARGTGQVHLHDLAVYILDTGDRNAVIQSLLSDEETGRYGRLLAPDWTRRNLPEVH